MKVQVGEHSEAECVGPGVINSPTVRDGKTCSVYFIALAKIN